MPAMRDVPKRFHRGPNDAKAYLPHLRARVDPVLWLRELLRAATVE